MQLFLLAVESLLFLSPGTHATVSYFFLQGHLLPIYCYTLFFITPYNYKSKNNKKIFVKSTKK